MLPTGKSPLVLPGSSLALDVCESQGVSYFHESFGRSSVQMDDNQHQLVSYTEWVTGHRK